MTTRALIATGVTVVAMTLLAAFAPRGDADPHPDGFALVELYTSEGCSSCPPADRLAAALAAEAQATGAPVHVLAFHVDYWDRLGWKDRFASPAFTRRQERYAKLWRSSQVYTPQMIVNGREEFVGSSAARARQAIAAARERPASHALRIVAVEPAGPRSLAVTVTVSRRPGTSSGGRGGSGGGGAVLSAAIIEDGLASEIARGENSGKRLEHAAVVRAFATVPLAAAEATALTVEHPADLAVGRAALVVYLQDDSTMEVLGAARRALVPPVAGRESTAPP